MMIPARRSLLVAAVLSALIALTGSLPVRAEEAPAKDAAPEPIAKQLPGVWTVDSPSTLAAMLAKAEQQTGQKPDEASVARMTGMVDQMKSDLLLEFQSDGNGTTHQPQKAEDFSYEISEEDSATGTFTLKVTPKDKENVEPSTVRINGDALILNIMEGQMELHLKRLSKEQAKARLAEFSKKGEGE